jgi:Outer membrane lipoprotein-sorting protein
VPLVLLVTLNEIENLLLPFGQSIHTGHLTSIMKHPPSQDHRESSDDEQREPALAATALLRYRWFNMKMFSVIALVSLFAFCAQADVASTNQNARAILERVLAQRPAKDFSLKARLFVGRADPVPVNILIKNTAEETRTIYRAGQTEALVVQPVHGEPRFYLRGRGELTGAQRSEKFLGSNFTYYDLGLGFLHWPAAKFLGEERTRGRDCYAIESTAEGEPYARVKIWIDKEFFALLRSEAFDANGILVRRFAITSFKKIGDFWIPRGLEAAYLPPGQSLPSEEKSRLEIYEGNYDTALPAAEFSTDRFTSVPH